MLQTELKKLHLGQSIWYCGVECVIDVLVSGNVFKGNGNLRIYPKDKVIHKLDGLKDLQGEGIWVYKDNEYLSLVAPPKALEIPVGKGKDRLGNFDFKKQRFIMDSLYEKGELILKLDGFADTLVKMGGVTKDISASFAKGISDPSGLLCCTINEVMRCMIHADLKDKWFLVKGK